MNRSRSVIVSASALGLALVLAAPLCANAQGGGGGGQGRGRALSLATMPISAIDSVVMLTTDEKTKIEGLQATYKTDIAAATGDQQKTREVRTKATADIKAALTTDQAAKLDEVLPSITMLNQSRAVPVATLAAVKLTPEQWTKIKASAKEAADKIAAAAQADRRQARTDANAAFKTAVEALLTQEQKDIIAKATPAATEAPAAPATKVL